MGCSGFCFVVVVFLCGLCVYVCVGIGWLVVLL